MGRPAGWAAKATGRPPMRSPGRPPVARREHRQRFWLAVAAGTSSEDAATAAGVSPAVGARWFREGGGMPTISPAPLSGRYLSFVEREEIAILHAQGNGVRQIAAQVGRQPSTISRELRRNAATRGGRLEYRATTAQCARRPAGRTAEGGQARSERRAPPVRARPPRRHDHQARRGRGTGSAGAVDWSPSRATSGPTLGDRVEPGADREPTDSRLPR